MTPDILKTAALIFCGVAAVLTSSSLNLEEKAKSSFSRVDQNHDGVLAFAEFKSFFDSLDTNNDGAWTLEEYSGVSEGTPVPSDVRGRFSYFDGLDGQVDNKAHKSGMEEPMKQYDINGDGQVTEQEFVSYFVESIRKFTTLINARKP